MSQSHLVGILLALVLCLQGASAQVMEYVYEYVYESWKAYSEECHRNMSLWPPSTDLVCNRTFDKYSCWPDAQLNSTVNVSCPWYLPWYDQVKHGYVFKKCGPDGQWETGPGGKSLRNADQCMIDNKEDQEWFDRIYGSFRVMYTVGYSVSLCALLLALAVLLGFSKLHCMRNYIHMNLFASFILKSVTVLTIDTLLHTRYSEKVNDYNVSLWQSDKAAAGCQAATVFMQYGIVANYCWLLVEGIYLYNLLVLTVFSERSYFTLYLCIGWGAPILFIVPWVVVKYLYENIHCWSTNNNMGFWWILRFPVFLAILEACLTLSKISPRTNPRVKSFREGSTQMSNPCSEQEKTMARVTTSRKPDTEKCDWQLVLLIVIVGGNMMPFVNHLESVVKRYGAINFFIFIRIIQILVSKLRAHQMRYTDYKFRLAKSTLTLIPLLGIHEMVFAFVIDEQAQGTLRFVKLFFDLFLGSFQGMLVAILYCFVNKEVQSELTKKWTRWKLGRDIEEEYKHTYSNTPNARNGRNSSTCEKHKLVGNYLNGLSCSQATVHTSTQYLERTHGSISENLAVNELPPCYEFPDMKGESNI